MMIMYTNYTDIKYQDSNYENVCTVRSRKQLDRLLRACNPLKRLVLQLKVHSKHRNREGWFSFVISSAVKSHSPAGCIPAMP